MEKTFDVTEYLNLPSNLNIKKLDEFYIIIDKNGVNWIVLEKEEYDLFKYWIGYTK